MNQPVGPPRGPVLVTGTDTGVGKTIVTAAVAVAATRAGLRVAVLKPAQTGDDRDVDTVTALAAPATAETLVTYPDPLAPATAARVAKLPALSLRPVVEAIRRLARDHDLVLIEGAGGALVPMGPDWTVADLARIMELPAIVVARAGLGTLNHTSLTLEALVRRKVATYTVIGAWPAEPELVHLTNLVDLSLLAGGLAGRLPDGAAALPPEAFREQAPTWLGPHLYGTWTPPTDITP